MKADLHACQLNIIITAALQDMTVDSTPWMRLQLNECCQTS